MRPHELTEALNRSLRRQERIHRSSLILNPVENLPFEEDLSPASGFLHGLYNSDKVRSAEQQKQTIHQFAGRRRLGRDSRLVYSTFAAALGAGDVSLRLLSGLHAHTVFFMAASRPGEKVLLLPERAGGHMSTKAILERLGLRIVEMVVDDAQRCVDIEATVRLDRSAPADFIFVDRSEGLVYEDFSALVAACPGTAVFDGSQYLANIITGDHPNPFGMGFDYLISTVHKNFPGPQKALIASRETTPRWTDILANVSVYVSNMHVFGTYAAGLTLARQDELRTYSRAMLDLTAACDEALRANGVASLSRPRERPSTHHIWIQASDRDDAFSMFQALERCRILANFRLLPYGIGYGLRLGLNVAARMGMKVEEAAILAKLIAEILREGPGAAQRTKARAFIEGLWDRHDGKS
jgi:glycine hydroxymethyltransferase